MFSFNGLFTKKKKPWEEQNYTPWSGNAQQNYSSYKNYTPYNPTSSNYKPYSQSSNYTPYKQTQWSQVKLPWENQQLPWQNQKSTWQNQQKTQTQQGNNYTPYIPLPETQTQQQTNNYTQTLPFQGNVERQRAIAEDRRNLQQESADRQTGNYEKIYNLKQEGLRAGEDDLKGNLENFITRQEQRVKDLGGETEEQKAGIRETRGEEMRRSAQTNRENQANLQNIFAGLGTVDSTAFQNQASAQTNRFTSTQTGTLRKQSDELNQADRDLQAYKYEAASLIDQEIANFNAALRDIQTQLQVGTIEYEEAVKQIHDNANNNIYSIEEGLANFEQTIEEKRANYELELMKLEQKEGSDKYNQVDSEIGSVISDLLSSNLGSVSGVGSYLPALPGTAGRRTESLYNRLSSLIQLKYREYMKGSGTISDFEGKILADASSELAKGLNRADLKGVLNKLASVYGVSGEEDLSGLYSALED